MDIDDLTIKQAKELAAMFSDHSSKIDNGMIGKYVVVRCREAGVHAGVLESYNGRECVLSNSRRLWRWVPAEGSKFLSGVAAYGICEKDGRGESKVGCITDRIHLTENCEIILCTDKAAKSIMEMKTDV